jgi:hypothetical protein
VISKRLELGSAQTELTWSLQGNMINSGGTALEDMKMLGITRRSIDRVLWELCYGKAETLGEVEEGARWLRYNCT